MTPKLEEYSWEKVCVTPEEIIEKYTTEDGTELKRVAPIHRMREATRYFGVYGKGWGLKNLKHTTIVVGNMTMACLDAEFYVKDLTDFEISTSTTVTNIVDGKMTLNIHFRKSLETDLIGKALSRLGFNADIYAETEAKVENREEVMNIDFIELGEKDD